MATIVDALLMEVLKACDQSTPEPLYPAVFAAYSGLDRNLLDEALDHLRLRGLIRFTDWVQGKGQGYALTSQGAMVLQNPALLRKAQPQVPAPQRSSPFEQGETPWARGEAVRDALVNPVRPVVTMTLLAINVIIFVMGIVPALQNDLRLEARGALVGADVLVGKQWWRILTYAFLHGGLIHLGMNMYFLYSLGPLLERMWGPVRFLFLYLVGALVGGCAVVLAMPAGPTVGASGALSGLLTSVGVWFFLNRNSLPPHLVSSMMSNVFTNIILMVIVSTMPNVSWQGHLGGAIGGALVSIPLNYQRFGRGWQKIFGLAGAIAVPVVAVALMFDYTDASLGEQQKARRDLYPIFRAAEENAATVFNAQAVPLFKGWGKEIDKSRLLGARKAFQEAQLHLQETVQTFDQAGPFKEKGVTQAIQNARVYLEEWSKFYMLFSQTTDQPLPWTIEQEKPLIFQSVVIQKARRPLVNSKLFPSAYVEKQ